MSPALFSCTPPPTVASNLTFVQQELSSPQRGYRILSCPDIAVDHKASLCILKGIVPGGARGGTLKLLLDTRRKSQTLQNEDRYDYCAGHRPGSCSRQSWTASFVQQWQPPALLPQQFARPRYMLLQRAWW